MEPAAVFRAAYGRQCSLAAQALAEPDPYHRNAVYLASVGKSLARDPVLQAISAQHRKVQEAWTVAHEVGCATEDLVTAAREIHLAIQGEWNVTLPLHASPLPSG